MAYSGVVAGTVHWTYNSDFRVNQETINGAMAASFGYDGDGLLLAAGALSLTPSPVNGLLATTTRTATGSPVSPVPPR